MLGKLRTHLTYANVIVTALLFVVLGGAAYAAFELPKNSVRSKHIVNGQVKAADVRNGALRRGDISAMTGSFSIDMPEIAAQSCLTAAEPLAGLRATDDVVLFPAPSANDYSGEGELIASGTPLPGTGKVNELQFRACNVSSAAVNPDLREFDYLVIR